MIAIVSMIGLRVVSGMPNLSTYNLQDFLLCAGKDAVCHRDVEEHGEGGKFLFLVKAVCDEGDKSRGGELPGLPS